MNLNDKECLEKLKSAVNSPNGRIIIDYFKSEIEQFGYDKIYLDRSFNEIGQDFKVFNKINKFFKDIFSFFESFK